MGPVNPLKIMASGSSRMRVSVSVPRMLGVVFVFFFYLMAKNDANETNRVSRYVSHLTQDLQITGAMCVH